MAQIIPDNRLEVEFNGSIGEKQLYKQFETLDDDYKIFHSVKWMNKKPAYVNFGETDYIILDVNRGIICLEVKHGGISGKNGRIYQKNRKFNSETEINPMFQADKSRYYFIEKLDKVSSKYKMRLPIYSAVIFSGITSESLVGLLPNEYKINGNTFFHERISDVGKLIDDFFEFHNVKREGYPIKMIREAINSISPEFKALQTLSNTVSQNEFIFNQLTNEQTYLLDYLEEQSFAAIQGGAGTGKTMIAIEKARRISENQKVIFLCFNNMLVSFLQKTYSKSLPNVKFANVYQLAAKALNKEVDEIDVQYFLEHIEDYPSVWDYESIIIDEAQDFSDEQMIKLKEIALLRDGQFYVFYDKNQLVQQRSELSWLQDMECRLILSANCRNTKKIAETSIAPLEIGEVRMKLPIEGDFPVFHISNKREELLNWLEVRIRKYLEEGINPNNIVILTVKTLEKSILSGENQIGDFKIGDFKIGVDSNVNNILFTTSRKFKGLEADVVLLIDVDAETFSNNEERRVFYVGASRAKSYLEIVALANKEEEKLLYKTISKGESERKAVLLSNLKTKVL